MDQQERKKINDGYYHFIAHKVTNIRLHAHDLAEAVSSGDDEYQKEILEKCEQVELICKKMYVALSNKIRAS